LEKPCTEEHNPGIKPGRIGGPAQGHKRNQAYPSSPSLHWDQSQIAHDHPSMWTMLEQFIQTGDNKADVFTKNVVRDCYDKHTNDMVWKAKDMDKEIKNDWQQKGCWRVFPTFQVHSAVEQRANQEIFSLSMFEWRSLHILGS